MKKTYTLCDRCTREIIPHPDTHRHRLEILYEGRDLAHLDLCAPCRVSFTDLFTSWKDQMK